MYIKETPVGAGMVQLTIEEGEEGVELKDLDTDHRGVVDDRDGEAVGRMVNCNIHRRSNWNRLFNSLHIRRRNRKGEKRCGKN